MSERWSLGVGGLAAVAVACGGSPKPNPPSHTVSGCSPLATGQCLTPFPNAWFEQAAPQTATGWEVVYPDGTLPTNAGGVPLRQASFGALDGFSPATPIVAYFPKGVDPSALVSAADPGASLSAQCPMALVDLSTGQRVAFFSELDANASPAAGDRQALLIHPMARLAHARRYAVAITTALHDGSGNPLAPEGQFQAWVQGTLSQSAPLAQIADRLDADAQAFAALGIPKSQLALAWDFDTASEAQATGRLVQMRDDVLAAAPQGLGYQIDVVAYDDGGLQGDAGDTFTAYPPDAGGAPDSGPYGAFRIVDGTFQAPSFEVGPDPAVLNVSPDGGAIMGAPADWNFTAVIPECAARAPAPVPLLIIGHGLFDTAHSELMDDRAILESFCMVGIGADWLGVTTSDQGIIGGDVLTDGNQFGLITDRLQQSHANFQVLTRLATHALAADPAFEIGGAPTYDPTQLYYWGASNGGIQGATYLALSPDVPRGVLNVPGAEWSFMIWRSSHFSEALFVLDASYPDKLDQQTLIALTQSLWDRTDPIEFAPHLADPLPGVPGPKQALFQESEGDAQVPNLSTQIEMRTVGAVGLAPLVTPVYGLSSQPGPLSGIVYTQWDVQPTPLPSSSDVPPQDNAAHEACRRLPQSIQQSIDFLQPAGQIVQTCSGPCQFPPGTGS
ncbi:MAG: alpha/beta hydrolase [Myxococcales bacterium]